MTAPRPAESSPSSPTVWARPGTLLAIGLLALALILGVVVAVTRDGSAPNSPDGDPMAGAGLGGSTGSIGDQRVPDTAPAGVRWELYRTVAVPFSESAGPRLVRGDVASGYAHTPTGALIASQQIAVRKLLADDWRAVTAASIAPGPGRDAWIAARGRFGRLAPPVPGQLGQVAGFRFVDYSAERAVIQFVSRFSSGRLQVITSTVAWDGQDWRLVLQPDGGESPTAQPVGSLAGFIAWGGV